jgi:putative ABC transport system permease protein
MALVIRAPRPASLAPAVAAAIRGLDPELPLVDVMTLENLLDESLAHQRFAMVLLSVFAGFALLLAAIGIYSVLSYAVRRRMQEIGIRVALGARRWDVLWLVIGHGLRLTAAGLVLGGAGALALSHLIAGLLYGVAPTDPTTFGAVAALLLAISLLACYLPARRAVRVDPMVSMRYE